MVRSPKKFHEFAPQFFEKTDFSAFFQNIGLNTQLSNEPSTPGKIFQTVHVRDKSVVFEVPEHLQSLV